MNGCVLDDAPRDYDLAVEAHVQLFHVDEDAGLVGAVRACERAIGVERLVLLAVMSMCVTVVVAW